jgi:hypothetical protein
MVRTVRILAGIGDGGRREQRRASSAARAEGAISKPSMVCIAVITSRASGLPQGGEVQTELARPAGVAPGHHLHK